MSLRITTSLQRTRLGHSSLHGIRYRPAAALLPARSSPPRGRASRLEVQANELNKWANRDARDEDHGLPDDGWDRDTASVVLRVLTARATQRVLAQLMEFDIFVAQWLNNFAADTSPSLGNKFISALLDQPGKAVTDPTSGKTHKIDPQSLAHRILQVREDMAKNVASGFSAYATQENTEVMRAHLTKNSYISGDTEKGPSDRRRGYYRPRSGPKR